MDAVPLAYRTAGDRILVDWQRSTNCAGTLTWNSASAPQQRVHVSCQQATARDEYAAASHLTAEDNMQLVRVVAPSASSDQPPRLVLSDRLTGRVTAEWPLAEMAATVSLYDGIAILHGATRSALYAMRLSDGRIAQLGIAGAGDRPLIGAAGVVYRNAVDRPKPGVVPRRATLTLLPLVTVRRELERPFSTVRMYMSYSRPGSARPSMHGTATDAAPVYRGADPPRPFTSPSITAAAMDGDRVALAVHDARGGCDYILFWNVLWHYATRLTRAVGPTCLPAHAPGGITDVAIAGSRAIWATAYGRYTRLLAATITGCVEWVVARPGGGSHGVVALSGSGGVLAYALRGLSGPDYQPASVGIVPASWAGSTIATVKGQVAALSVSDGRVAILRQDGVVALTTRGGHRLGHFRVGRALALSLRPGALTVLGPAGHLAVYDTTGHLDHSWRVPENVTTLDTEFGIAVVATDHDAYAVSLTTGRLARIAHAAGRLLVQLGSPGAAIEIDAHGRASLRFVPMSRLQARLR